MNPNDYKMLLAYNMMLYGNKQYFERKVSSKQYESLKLKFSELQSIRTTGNKNPNFGKPKSEETKMKIGLGNKGKIRTEEMKDKLRGRALSDLHKHHISLGCTGIKHSEETKEKLRGRLAWNKGIPISHEALFKLTQCKIKRCSIDNVEYASSTDASKTLDIKKNTIVKRIRSRNFANYFYL